MIHKLKCFIMVSMLCMINFCPIGEVKAKMLIRKDLEPTGIVTWDVPLNKKVIALTFDDGPSVKYTPQVLDVLKKYDAKATFFMIGFRMEQSPQLVQAVLKNGHEIGNHTMNHIYAQEANSQIVKHDILKGQEFIEKWSKDSILFRPPGGYINETVLTMIEQQHGHIVLWSWHQDPRDWSKPGIHTIVNHVLKNARGGDIVLLHDGGPDQQQTVEALKIILPKLKERGFQFVTVSELLQYKNQ